MNDLPNNLKESFSNLENTIQTKHIIEVIKEFESLLQKIIINEKISCETDCLIDISKSKELLGFKPKFTQAEGLKKYFNWYNKKYHVNLEFNNN